MRFPLIFAFTTSAFLGACGDDDPPTTPGPCDDTTACLTAIDDQTDWDAVAEAQTGARCDFADETKYIAPASSDAALQSTVYQDVSQNRFHVEFLRTVLAEWFPGLTPDQYATLVQRRATRTYWGGAIARVVDADGVTVGYGFDVIVDQADPTEAVTEAEVEAIHAILVESFHLPLGYAPRTQAAILAAQDWDLPFDLHLPRDCAPAADCEDPNASCIVAPEAITLCGMFIDDRPIQLEYERKIRVTVPAGAWALPTADAPGEALLITSGEYGPDRAPVVATTPGTLTRREDFDVWEYEQELSVDGQTITIWAQWYGVGPTEILLAEPNVSEGYGFFGTIDAGGKGNNSLHIQSCDYPSLEPWSAIGTLEGGDSFRIQYQYRPPFAGSSPIAPQSATVTLDGQTHVVDDYFQLVYAGLHHNFDNQWWVLFDEPVTYQGHQIHGIWVDQGNYDWDPVDGVYTLDENLQALDTLTVIDYAVAAD